ncbi:MAG: YIP1 family protein [Thermoanaerobaculia bacterium]
MHFLANLATVVVRPRSTMARILGASPRNWTVWLLFALTAISGIFGDVDAPMVGQVLEQTGGVRVTLIVVGVLAGLIVLLPVLFWFYAYVPFFIGRFLGGTGEIRGVRAALAWGLAPVIWALLYRVPAALWFSASSATSVRMRNGNVAFDPGLIADGCGIALFFAFLELIVFVWCAFVMSNTVAEAHGFTAWHGLGTLVIAAIAPLVVVLAAVLALT